MITLKCIIILLVLVSLHLPDSTLYQKLHYKRRVTMWLAGRKVHVCL